MNRFRKHAGLSCWGVVVLALGLIPAQLAGQTTLYNNLGPGNTSSGSGYTDGIGAGVVFVGTRVTATAGGALSTVLTFFNTSFATTVTMGLYTDSGGQPGTLLESWSAPTVSQDTPGLITLTSVVHPVLTSGTPYWFVINPPNANRIGTWYQNNQGVNGGMSYGSSANSLSSTLNSSGATPAIQLNAAAGPVPTPTPLPPSIFLTLIGLACVGLYFTRTTRAAARQ